MPCDFMFYPLSDELSPNSAFPLGLGLLPGTALGTPEKTTLVLRLGAVQVSEIVVNWFGLDEENTCAGST